MPVHLPSFLLVGGVATLGGCTVGGAGFAVVGIADDLAADRDTVGVTEAVTTGDTGYLE